LRNPTTHALLDCGFITHSVRLPLGIDVFPPVP
jgi:hypothetical protein